MQCYELPSGYHQNVFRHILLFTDMFRSHLHPFSQEHTMYR